MIPYILSLNKSLPETSMSEAEMIANSMAVVVAVTINNLLDTFSNSWRWTVVISVGRPRDEARMAAVGGDGRELHDCWMVIEKVVKL